MKNINRIATVGFLSMISFSGIAQTVSATASTLDAAEEKIALKAQKEQKSYKIISASTGNRVHMTAVLSE